MKHPKTSMCVDCGIAIDRRARRCQPCHFSHRHASLIRSTTCPQCGGKKHEEARTCRECLRKTRGVPEQGPNPSGLCMCGCGQPAPIAKETSTRNGYVKGQPVRFIYGHQSSVNRSPVDYIEEDRGYESPCWIWKHGTDKRGYGKVRRRKVGIDKAHRLYYTLYVGAIPEGHDIHHRCLVPSCVNPSHLEPVQQPLHTATKHSRLSDDDVRTIRELAEHLTRKETARLFGICPTYVSQIVNLKVKTHVK